MILPTPPSPTQKISYLMVLYIIIPASSNFSHFGIPFLLYAFNISCEMYNIPLPDVITCTYHVLPSNSVGSLRPVLVVNFYVPYQIELSSSYRYESPMRI